METAIFEALDVVSKSKLSETRFDYDITNLAKTVNSLLDEVIQELEQSETIEVNDRLSLTAKCYTAKTIVGAMIDKAELSAIGFDWIDILINEKKRIDLQAKNN